jgi:acyl-CoA dehydrogenase
MTKPQLTAHLLESLYLESQNGVDFTTPTSGGFPMALWEELANKGLLSSYSTEQSTYRDIAAAGLALTKRCGHLGLTMTWLGQLLKLSFLKDQGKPSNDAVSAILSGDALCSLAISEPGAGAHPKHLSCTATRRGDGYVLNGQKAYVSHGPYADWFIVLAITDVVAEKKQFSAFLIHKTLAGLTLGPGEKSARLAPSSHCTITFDQCQVSEQALVGTPGRAFEEISKPMRTLEDVLMLAPIAGAIQVQLELLTTVNPSSCNKDDLSLDLLGRCLCLAQSIAELGLLSAQKLDEKAASPDLTALIIGTRTLIIEVQTHLEPLLHFHPRLETLFNDIQLLTSIAQGATQARVQSIAAKFLADSH